MIPNVSDAESSYLNAKAEHEKWIKEFMFQWWRPMIEMTLVMLAQQDPSDLQGQMITKGIRGETNGI